jgi:hypothetical protein
MGSDPPPFLFTGYASDIIKTSRKKNGGLAFCHPPLKGTRKDEMIWLQHGKTGTSYFPKIHMKRRFDAIKHHRRFV